MADTANRPDLDIDDDLEEIAANDPLAQLAFLMGDAPAASLRPNAPARSVEIEPASLEEASGEPAVSDAFAETEGDIAAFEAAESASDLEETLMAELGAPEPVASETHEFVDQGSADVEDADFTASIENVTTYDEPQPVRSSVEPPAMSLEDELQALLGGNIEVASPVDALSPVASWSDDAPAADVDADPDTHGEPEAALEPQFAVDEVESDIVDDERAYAESVSEVDPADDLEEVAVVDESDAEDARFYAEAEKALLDDAYDEPHIPLSASRESGEPEVAASEPEDMRKPFFAPIEDAQIEEASDDQPGFDDWTEEFATEEIEAVEASLSDADAQTDDGQSETEDADIGLPIIGAAAASAAYMTSDVQEEASSAPGFEAAAQEPELETDLGFEAPHEEVEPVVATPAAKPTAVVDDAVDPFSDFDAALEDDFSQLFDEEIAAETQAAAAEEPQMADVSELSPLDELEALMSDSGPLLSSGEAKADGPPDFDTVDMSAFDARNAATYDLPESETITAAPAAASAGDDDLDIDLDDDAFFAATGVAASAAAVKAAVAKPAPATNLDFDDAFNESMFEAELARDIEYAAHDRKSWGTESDLGSTPDMPVAAHSSSGRRGLFIAGAVGAVALAGLIGVLALSGGETATDDTPVVVAADPDPVKVAPEEPGGQQVPNQDRVVFGAEDGITDDAAQEALVTTSEEPVDIATAPGISTTGSDAEKAAERLAETDQPITATEADNRDSGLTTPRRVRTLIVKPDGSLVEKPAAPAEQTEVAAAVAPTVEETATTPATDAAPETATAVAETAAQSEETDVPERVAAVATAEPEAVTAPAVPVRTVTTTVVSPPLIRDRPADQPVNIVNDAPQRPSPTSQVAVETAAAPAAAPAAPAAPAAAPVATSSSSPFAVQISSQTSRDAAQQSAADLLSRYRNVLGGRDVSIQEANIAGKGTYYRVRVGASSRDEATTLCENYKRAGGSCFVAR